MTGLDKLRDEEVKKFGPRAAKRRHKEREARRQESESAVPDLVRKAVEDGPPSAGKDTVVELDDGLTVEEFMEKQFATIIGHDSIKKQLRTFYKKVQLDKIRAAAGNGADGKNRLYHMIFTGPPGTGKTTMAALVGKVMLKMQLVMSEHVVFINNALDLLAGYAGQTPAKVDGIVQQAQGGILFIDEAYSIVKSKTANQDSFGREAIDTIMKHMDPPSCVFIFAGYSDEMDNFMKVNQGLARRIPYRYEFQPYAVDQLLAILNKMCENKKEVLGPGVMEAAKTSLLSLDEKQRRVQNAGLISNWLHFAQMERDDRIDLDAAAANPQLARLLEVQDFEGSVTRLSDMG